MTVGASEDNLKREKLNESQDVTIRFFVAYYCFLKQMKNYKFWLSRLS